MAAPEVRRRWNVRLPLTIFGSGSGYEGRAPVCTGRVRGVAFFAGTLKKESDMRFLTAWFFGGMKTDRGIGVGSTLAALRRAYGTELERPYANVYRVSLGPGKRNAIVFPLNKHNRVNKIGFGWRGLFFGSGPNPSVAKCQSLARASKNPA